MNGDMNGNHLNRMTGLLRRSRAGSARPMPRTRSAATDSVLAPAGDDGLSADLREWAHTPARIPWLEGAEYLYRLGSHHLMLASRGESSPDEYGAAVGRAEVQFALVVEGPLLVLGSRFGDTEPWRWASP